MTKDQLKDLRNDLRKPEVALRQTELYKLLKVELTRLGYWKNKPRGNPRKGFRQSPMAQLNIEIRKQAKENNLPSIVPVDAITYEPTDD